MTEQRYDSGALTIPIPEEVLAKFRKKSTPPAPVVCIKCSADMAYDAQSQSYACLTCGGHHPGSDPPPAA